MMWLNVISGRFPESFAHSICGLSRQKVIKRMLIFQIILKLLKTTSCAFCSRHKAFHISTLVCPNDMKPRWLLPHEPLRLIAQTCRGSCLEYIYVAHPNSSMPRHACTVRARSSLLAAFVFILYWELKGDIDIVILESSMFADWMSFTIFLK